MKQQITQKRLLQSNLYKILDLKTNLFIKTELTSDECIQFIRKRGYPIATLKISDLDMCIRYKDFEVYNDSYSLPGAHYEYVCPYCGCKHRRKRYFNVCTKCEKLHKNDIVLHNENARNLGMSYGKYMAKFIDKTIR